MLEEKRQQRLLEKQIKQYGDDAMRFDPKIAIDSSTMPTEDFQRSYQMRMPGVKHDKTKEIDHLGSLLKAMKLDQNTGTKKNRGIGKENKVEGVKCVGMPDSGFFLDYQADDVPETPPSPPEATVDSFTSRRVLNTIPGDYHAGLKWCFETFNATAGVNPACIEAHHTGGPATDDPDWLCMFAEHSAAFTHTPIFPLQSEVRYCGYSVDKTLPLYHGSGLCISKLLAHSLAL